MIDALSTMARIAELRLRVARNRRLEATDALAAADRAHDRASSRRAAAADGAAVSDREFRQSPGCPQRAFLHAARHQRRNEAENALADADARRVEAAEACARARLAEARAEQRRDLVKERCMAQARTARDRSEEREGEERWIAAPTG